MKTKVFWGVIGVLVIVIIALVIMLKQTHSNLIETSTNLEQKTSGPGIYKVTLVKRNLTDLDWNTGIFGNPLEVCISIYKDGYEVYSRHMTGERGEHVAKECTGGHDVGKVIPITFEIEYSPTSKYIIKWNEASIVAKTNYYIWGENDRPGNWPFDTRIYCEGSSWFEFSATKLR